MYRHDVMCMIYCNSLSSSFKSSLLSFSSALTRALSRIIIIICCSVVEWLHNWWVTDSYGVAGEGGGKTKPLILSFYYFSHIFPLSLSFGNPDPAGQSRVLKPSYIWDFWAAPLSIYLGQWKISGPLHEGSESSINFTNKPFDHIAVFLLMLHWTNWNEGWCIGHEWVSGW